MIICLRKTLLNSHQCRTDSGKDNCPVCFENVHSASEPAFVPKCSHLIHVHCYKRIEMFGFQRCPLCYTSYSEAVNPRASWIGLVSNALNNNNVDIIAVNTINNNEVSANALSSVSSSIENLNNNPIPPNLNQQVINQQVVEEMLETLSIEDISFLLNDNNNMH